MEQIGEPFTYFKFTISCHNPSSLSNTHHHLTRRLTFFHQKKRRLTFIFLKSFTWQGVGLDLVRKGAKWRIGNGSESAHMERPMNSTEFLS
jgi:hypothetical protein